MRERIKESEKEENIVEEARELYQRDSSYWNGIYDRARDDLYFLSDAEDAQWEQGDYAERRRWGRAAITVDKLSQFVHQVANEQRMQTPSINVIPSDQKGSSEVAKVFKGLIKNIEFRSRADNIYDNAGLFAIKSSIGFIRVDHEFCDDGTFNQQLVIKPVVNPFSIFIDKNSIYSDGSDAKHCTVLEQISVDEFNERWPDFTPSDFASPKRKIKTEKGDENVTVAEFFRLVKTRKSIKASNSDFGEVISDYSEGDEESPGFIKKRDITEIKVERYWLSGQDVLEKTSFPGKYIPIVPVYGEEAWIDGKRELYSLIRRGKGAQMLHNYLKSLEIETLRKQPIAPIMAAQGTVEDNIDDWRSPSKAAVLIYKQTDIDGNPANMPTRLSPPGLPSGFAQAAAMSVDDIKSALGIYNASLGQASNETSGIAINARKIEGDTATFHFTDNRNRSVAQVGNICVNAIPEIYDLARVEFITGEEGNHKQIGLNGAMVPGQEEVIDLTKGKYSVDVVTGSSYATMRQESADFYQRFMQSAPNVGILMADLMLKNSDIAGADEAYARMKRIIEMQSPGLIEDENEQQGQPGQQQVMAIQQQAQQIITQLQKQNMELQQQLQSKDSELQLRAMDIQSKSQIEQAKLAVSNSKNEDDASIKALELSLKQRELEIKEQQVAANIALQTQGQKLDYLMAAIQQISSVLPQHGIGMQESMANHRTTHVDEYPGVQTYD